MRMPWSKSNELQLDLLEAAAAPEDVSTPSFTTSTVAGQPLMLELASLYEDANNPRTEVALDCQPPNSCSTDSGVPCCTCQEAKVCL